MSIFEEADKFSIEKEEEKNIEPKGLFEEADAFMVEEGQEVPEPKDIPTTGEALSKNLVIGFHDYLSLMPGEWHKSETIDEWRDQVKTLSTVTPDIANDLFVSSSKYVSDVVAMYAARSQLVKYKYTANMVHKVEKLLTSKKYKESMLAAGFLAEAEEALSSAVHKEEYTPGMGFIFGSTVAGTVVSGQKAAPIIGVGLLKAKKTIDNAKEQIDILYNSIDKSDKDISAPKAQDRKDREDKETSIDARMEAETYFKDIKTISDDKPIPTDKTFTLDQIMDSNNQFFEELRNVQIQTQPGFHQPQILRKEEAGGADILEIGEEILKHRNIRSILEEEVGHILDRNRGITEQFSFEKLKQNIPNLRDIMQKSGIVFDADQLEKYFNISELRQNPARLQNMLHNKEGIKDVLDDKMFNLYEKVASPYMTQKYDLKTKKGMSDYIEDVFDTIKTKSGMDTVKPLKKEVKSVESFDESMEKLMAEGKKELSPEEQSKLVDLNQNRNFWNKSDDELLRDYDLMSDAQKADFAAKFSREADLGDTLERMSKLEDDIKKREDLVGSTRKDKADAEKELKSILKDREKAQDKAAFDPQVRERKAYIDMLDKKIKLQSKDVATKEAEMAKVKQDEMKTLEEIMANKKAFSFYVDEILADIDRRILLLTRDPDIKKAPRKKETKTESKTEPKESTLKKWRDDIDIKDKDHKSLMGKIMSNKEMKDVKIVYGAKKPSDKDKGVLASYFPETNHIEVYTTDPSKMSKAVLHESIHALTYHKVRANDELYDALDKVRQEMKDKTGSEGYWSKNVDEMLAEFFSNKKVEAGLTGVKTSQTIPKTYLRKIVDIILNKVFGIEPKAKLKDADQVLKDALEELAGIKIFKETGMKAEIDKAITKGISKATLGATSLLRKHNIFKIDKEGTVTIGSFETDVFKTMLGDLGVANKDIMSEISGLRRLALGLQKEINEHAKVVGKSIQQEMKKHNLTEQDLTNIISGRVATVLSKIKKEDIENLSPENIAKKHNIRLEQLQELVEGFGQQGVGAKNHFKNTNELISHLKSRGFKIKSDFEKDFELVFARHVLDGDMASTGTINSLLKLKDSDLMKTLRELEQIENASLGSKAMYGYMGHVGKHDFNLHVAKSIDEIEVYKKDRAWKQVGDSNTFYQLNLEPNVSNGILPSSARPFQGTIITKNIKENRERLDKEGIKYSVTRKNGKDVSLRLFPDEQTAKVLGYETDPSILMARKFKLLSEQAIRKSVASQVSDKVKSLFSSEPKDGFVKVSDDMSIHYKKMIGHKDDSPIYVKKEFADILVGVKEAMIYKGDSRLLRTMEKSYKDLFKRFKRAVTIKSPSSIVNNYLVIPSMLKMSGMPAKDIPQYMRDAHKNYADYIEGMEKYHTIKMKSGDKAANAFLKSFKRQNIIAEMMDGGILQSSVDDALIQLANESDMLRYGVDKILGFQKSKASTVADFIELNPDSAIGKFFLNKFVMADIVGRASLYTFLRTKKGLSSKEAEKKALDAFVDFNKPLPHQIRVLEEYGVPFIGWMYRMQVPIYKMIKENPTDAATVVATYYALQAMFDDSKDNMQDGYMGDVKIDSWFLHNSLGDTGVLSGSPLAKGELPNIKPQLHKEIAAVAEGTRNPLEILGLNIKYW